MLAGVVEEGIARGFLRLAGQIVDLVDAIELGLDDAGILTFLDLLLQVVAFGPAGDFDEGGQPVEGREDIVQDRARLDVPGQRTTAGARMPPSQVVSLPPLNGVVPPSG